MKIPVKNLNTELSQRQKDLISNNKKMAKYKMVEQNNEAKEGECGWIESELESDNLVDAMKEALATKDIFVGAIES